VHAVAIGDPDQGHPVPTGNGNQFVTFEGQPVLSRRVDTALEAIARQTDGALIKLGLAAADLGTLYRERIAPVARRKREAAIPERAERFPLCLTAALGFLLAGCWPAGRQSPWRWIWNRATGGLLVSAVAIVTIGAGKEDAGRSGDRGTPDSAADQVQTGRTAYERGKLDEALAAFQAAIALAPDEPVPRYDAAAALFALKRYGEARDLYQQAREHAGPSLRTKIDFALGNTALALGDIVEAVEQYDQCLASTAVDPGLESVREDAAINRQFALEQANPALAGEGENEGSGATSPNRQRNRAPRSRRNGAQGNEPAPDDPEGAGTQGDGSNPQGDGEGQGQSRPAGGRRRTGGAGGASRSPGSSGETADDRLDNALEQIREAERRRLPEEAESEPPDDHRKDW
jgi:Ca-activated chloride channel family protein